MNRKLSDKKKCMAYVLNCTCQEKVDSKKNIYQKPRLVLN